MVADVVFLIHVGNVPQEMVASEIGPVACAHKIARPAIVRGLMASQVLAHVEHLAALTGVPARCVGLALMGTVALSVS